MPLADVYDALSSKRVYKEAYSHEIARSIIIEGAGKHFDPDIVAAFLACESQFADIRRQYSAHGNSPATDSAIPPTSPSAVIAQPMAAV